MDLNRLRYFCTVAGTGSIRKASEILRISPPALSKAVALLEAEVGKKLILPAGRGITISEAGNWLATQAAPLLEAFDQLEQATHRESVATLRRPVLRLASFEVFTSWLLGPIISRTQLDRDLRLHETVPGEMEYAIENHHADFGITYIPIPSQNLDHIKVAHFEMAIFGRKRKFMNTIYDQLPFVVPVTPVMGSPNKVRGLDGWPEDKIPRTIVYRVTLMESALELCRQALAVGYFPEPVVRRHNEVVSDRYRLTALEMPRGLAKYRRQDVYLIKRKSDAESEMFKKLQAAIRFVAKV